MKQRYDSYKPSGIDWIGDIPSHWTLSKIKFIGEIRGRIGFRGYTTADLVSEGEGALTIGGKHISNNVIDLTDPEYISWDKYYESPEIMVSQGDIVIAQRGTLKRTAYISKNIGPATINPSLVLLTNIKINPKYLHSYLCSNATTEFIDYLNTATAVPMISQNQIENIRIIEPPLAEQEAIAAWLDEKCGEIDAAIAKVDREIELIDELKQSEISRVVTRGLNPDAPLRPSGIDWIGDIPEHWTKCRLKFIGSARNGLTYSPSDVKDSGKLVIRSSNIQDSKLNYDDCVFVANYPETLSVNSGDTIICSRNGSINLIGKSVFIEDDMDVTFGAFMMRFRPYEHPKYSHYLLSIAISRYKGLFATTTINQLTADSLGKMEAVMPPYMEQVQIADYLDKKCAAIDGLKAKLIKKRETLTELRQSIISEVVTGKRKVI